MNNKAKNFFVSGCLAEWLGSRLVNPGTYYGEKDEPLSSVVPWPNAAYNTGNQRMAAEGLSEYPLAKRQSRLPAFATDNWPDLCEQALSGFISYATDVNTRLRYPDGFIKALEKRRAELFG